MVYLNRTLGSNVFASSNRPPPSHCYIHFCILNTHSIFKYVVWRDFFKIWFIIHERSFVTLFKEWFIIFLHSRKFWKCRANKTISNYQINKLVCHRNLPDASDDIIKCENKLCTLNSFYKSCATKTSDRDFEVWFCCSCTN